jgi:hypothetical protein
MSQLHFHQEWWREKESAVMIFRWTTMFVLGDVLDNFSMGGDIPISSASCIKTDVMKLDAFQL